MTDTMTIRHATPADGPELRAMHCASLRVLGTPFYSTPTIEAFLAEVGTLDEAVLIEETCLVIAAGSEIVASAAWTLRPPAYGGRLPAEARPAAGARRATIRSVFAGPRFARLGLASKLMGCCEAEAAEQGEAAGIGRSTRPGADPERLDVPAVQDLHRAAGRRHGDAVAARGDRRPGPRRSVAGGGNDTIAG